MREKERKDSNLDSDQGDSKCQEDDIVKSLNSVGLNDPEENEEKKFNEEEDNKPEESKEGNNVENEDQKEIKNEEEKGNYLFFNFLEISETPKEEESVALKEDTLPEDDQKIELLDYLLNFLETDNTLNHVLAGYFSKFLILLLNKSQKTVKIKIKRKISI